MFTDDYIQFYNAMEDTDIMREEMEADDMVNAILMELLSSLEEEDEDGNQWGGSKPGCAPNKCRDFGGAYARLVKDYFNVTALVHNETDFERRFRMPRAVFNAIQDDVMDTDPFVQKTDVCGKQGIYLLVKLIACLRFLAYGDSLDQGMRTFKLHRGLWLPWSKNSAA
jgi:hypothetical protein